MSAKKKEAKEISSLEVDGARRRFLHAIQCLDFETVRAIMSPSSDSIDINFELERGKTPLLVAILEARSQEMCNF